MQEIDKFRKNLDAALKRSASSGEAKRLEDLRQFFYQEFRPIPQEALAALFVSFLEVRRKDGEERGLAWLGGVASLLLQDYDGTDFSHDEWVDIKESLLVAQEEIDMDLLSYIMALVLDHKAL
jgi:hypothetical protein